eukprot:3043121-Amphidinium_carterae.1
MVKLRSLTGPGGGSGNATWWDYSVGMPFGFLTFKFFNANRPKKSTKKGFKFAHLGKRSIHICSIQCSARMVRALARFIPWDLPQFVLSSLDHEICFPKALEYCEYMSARKPRVMMSFEVGTSFKVATSSDINCITTQQAIGRKGDKVGKCICGGGGLSQRAGCCEECSEFWKAAQSHRILASPMQAQLTNGEQYKAPRREITRQQHPFLNDLGPLMFASFCSFAFIPAISDNYVEATPRIQRHATSSGH